MTGRGSAPCPLVVACQGARLLVRELLSALKPGEDVSAYTWSGTGGAGEGMGSGWPT